MKGFLIGGMVFYALVVVAALLFTATRREDFHSPATVTRDAYGFREGDFGLLETAERETKAVWAATEAMSDPCRIEGADDSFALDWSKEAKKGATPVTPPSRWVEALEGDDRVDLVAFASWVPRADDHDTETQLLGFIGVGAQLAWKSSERWDDHPPSDMPADRTFRDTTPQALLDWYLDHTPGARVRYDPDGLVLHINEEESDWWSRMKEIFQRVIQSF